MKEIFDTISGRCSKQITRSYSTSFSLGIYFLDRKLHAPIYAIYGFVRAADEIVDSFHDYERAELLSDFRQQTFEAIRAGISLNPILNSFQRTVRRYNIENELIEVFLNSMAMDLEQDVHDRSSFDDYILGSAEVVGLMCLRVFCNGDGTLYASLKRPAMKLGAAFQKVNFLRDLRSDYFDLGRRYVPNIDLEHFGREQKRRLEQEIKADFKAALEGIRRLPKGARFGVYVAYVYYQALLRKIERTPGEELLQQRLRVPAHEKFALLVSSYLRYTFAAL